MIQISASEFQRNIGEYVSKAISGDAIHVLAHGRPTVVVISAKEYETLIEAQRQWTWTRLARIGDIGSTETQ